MIKEYHKTEGSANWSLSPIIPKVTGSKKMHR